MVYWRLKEYLGFGVSAASFFKGRRFSNKRSISEYISVMNDSILNKENPDISLDAFHVIDEDINAERLMEEYMFLGLRMTGGVSAAEFDDYFGHSLYDIYGEVIKKYTDTGYMTNDGGIISLTNQGIDVSNIILSDFLLD
jgi:oxygen-independent coproporphyrinogen-3 oxidase